MQKVAQTLSTPQPREAMRQQHWLAEPLIVMMCSRRNCSYWRHCEREWGGEVPGVMKPPAKSALPCMGFGTQPCCCMRIKERHRSLPHISAWYRPEIPRLFRHPALRQAPPHRYRQLSPLGPAEIPRETQPRYPGPLVRLFNLKPQDSRMVHIGGFARVPIPDRNRALLGIIAESAPESLARLAEMNGAAKIESFPDAQDHGALWLRSSQPRIVDSLIPRVPYQRISLTLPLSKTGHGGTKAA